MTPLVSVIIPAYNSAAFLGEAIASVQSQGIANVELIVVDDGSTDETAAVAANYAVTYLCQTNQGPAAARNAGLEIAQGRYIAFNDADDVWVANRLSYQLEQLQKNRTLDIIQGQLQYLHRVENLWQLNGQPFFAMQLGTGVFRQEVFEKIGRFDSQFPVCEDVAWFFRAQRHGINVKREEQVVLHYRRHDNNLTNHTDLIRKQTLRVVHAHRKALRERDDNT